MAGATLCATMLSGWLNGRDRRDDADRLALGEDLPRLALRRQIAGEDLSVIEDGELAGEREDVIGAPAFIERILLRNAEFERDEIGKRVLARRE